VVRVTKSKHKPGRLRGQEFSSTDVEVADPNAKLENIESRENINFFWTAETAYET